MIRTLGLWLLVAVLALGVGLGTARLAASVLPRWNAVAITGAPPPDLPVALHVPEADGPGRLLVLRHRDLASAPPGARFLMPVEHMADLQARLAAVVAAGEGLDARGQRWLGAGERLAEVEVEADEGSQQRLRVWLQADDDALDVAWTQASSQNLQALARLRAYGPVLALQVLGLAVAAAGLAFLAGALVVLRRRRRVR